MKEYRLHIYPKTTNGWPINSEHITITKEQADQLKAAFYEWDRLRTVNQDEGFLMDAQFPGYLTVHITASR